MGTVTTPYNYYVPDGNTKVTFGIHRYYTLILRNNENYAS